MGEKIKQLNKKDRQHSILFIIISIVALGLFIAGFCVPPTGMVDGSVLTGMGILMGFGVIAELPRIIAIAETAKVTVGGTEIEITSKGKEEDNK